MALGCPSGQPFLLASAEFARSTGVNSASGEAAIAPLLAQAAQPAGLAQGSSNAEDRQGAGNRRHTGGDGKTDSLSVGIGVLEIDRGIAAEEPGHKTRVTIGIGPAPRQGKSGLGHAILLKNSKWFRKCEGLAAIKIRGVKIRIYDGLVKG